MKYYLGYFFLLFILKAEAQTSASAVADSLYLIGNYTKAINAYAVIGDENASLQIARAYAAMNNNEKAIAQYQGHVKTFPESVLAKFELGKLYDKTKNYEAAISIFKDLTNLEVNNPEFYFYLGKSLQATLDFENGNQALNKAVALDSTHLKSIYLLGKYYVQAEEPTNAFKVLNLGLKSAPNDVALMNLKALNHFNLGEYEPAAKLFERLLELGEKKPFVYKKLGYALANRWQYEKAKMVYRQLEKIPNSEADAYFGLGGVFLKEQQLDSAAVYIKKSIEARRYNFAAEYQDLGRIARLNGQLKKSLDYYTKAWEEQKTNQLNYWQVCILADEYYKDPKIKLRHYEKLLSDFDNLLPFLKERAQNRVTELKEEIHFTKD